MTADQSTPDIQQSLTDLGVTDDVRSFVRAVTELVTCLAAQAPPTYVRLVGADQAQTSLYVHKAFVSIALPPDESKHWSLLTGASLQKKPATHYLLVREKQLTDPRSCALAVAAAVASIVKYREVHVGAVGVSGTGEGYSATCPKCFEKLSVNGKCSCVDD